MQWCAFKLVIRIDVCVISGHYIPQLAMKIVEYNKQPNIRPIKLKSIAVISSPIKFSKMIIQTNRTWWFFLCKFCLPTQLGNPLLDLEISVLSEQYLWSHGAISDDTLMLKQKLCNDSRFLHEYVHKNISQECSHVFKLACRPLVYQIENFEINIIPLIAKLVTQGIPILLYRFCVYITLFVFKVWSLNQFDKWKFCVVLVETKIQRFQWHKQEQLLTILPTNWSWCPSQHMLHGIAKTRYVCMYMCVYIYREREINAGYEDVGWMFQVGGWSQSFGNKNNEKYLMAFASVRGGGHEVPFTSPSQALTLFTSFLLGSPLPRPNFSKPNNLAHQLNWWSTSLSHSWKWLVGYILVNLFDKMMISFELIY